MSLPFAMLAAAAAALNRLSQRVSSNEAPSGSPFRLARYLLGHPLWLFGALAALASVGFHALALHFGSLSAVQPVLVTELVFVLLLRRMWLRQPVRRAAWASAALTCMGLAIFLIAAEPRGGNPSATGSAWASAITACGALVLIMLLLGARGSPVRRAALFGSAAGIVAALFATFLKETASVVAADGPVAALTSWPIVAVLVTGVVSVITVQAALHVGPLTVSQPLIVVVDPMVSIVLSVRLFAEYFTDDVAVITLGYVAFTALVLGVVLLTRTAPRDDSGPNPRPAEDAGVPTSDSADATNV